MGSVVLFDDGAKIKHVFQKTWLISYGLLQGHIPSFHNLITRGKSTLDRYDIMASNQKLYAEYEWHFQFRNLTVDLCYDFVCETFV